MRDCLCTQLHTIYQFSTANEFDMNLRENSTICLFRLKITHLIFYNMMPWHMQCIWVFILYFQDR